MSIYGKKGMTTLSAPAFHRRGLPVPHNGSKEVGDPRTDVKAGLPVRHSSPILALESPSLGSRIEVTRQLLPYMDICAIIRSGIAEPSGETNCIGDYYHIWTYVL